MRLFKAKNTQQAIPGRMDSIWIRSLNFEVYLRRYMQLLYTKTKLFFYRILPGATSFNNLKTYAGITYSPYRKTAFAMGLI